MFALNKLRIAYWMLLTVSAALAAQIILAPPTFTGTDLPSWGNDWSSFLCALDANAHCPQISKFPLAYLLNSLVSTLIHANSKGEAVFFANLLIVLSSIYFVHRVTKRLHSQSFAVSYAIALTLTVIPPFYTYSGALELQYGVILGLFSACIYLSFFFKDTLRGITTLLCLTSFALPLYKDVSIALMGVILIAALYARAGPLTFKSAITAFRDSRDTIFIVSGASTASISLTFAYNYFRYESIFPTPYLAEALQAAPPYGVKLGHAFWLIFSPNGGLIVAWFASFFALLVLLKVKGRRASEYSILVTLGIVALNIFILANWWTPFGWEGWGNRLLLPSAVAALLTLTATSARYEVGDPHSPRTARKVTKHLLYPVVAIFSIASLFYISISYSARRDDYLQYSLWGSDACKAVAQLRDERPMWEFKKTAVHLKCHQERFAYIPGLVPDMSPLSVTKLGKHVIRNGNGGGLIGKGWSHVEDWGVWSDGNSAEVRFIPSERIRKISLELQPFIFGELADQTVSIEMLGQHVATRKISSTETIQIDLPAEYEYNQDEIIRVALHLPNATAPAQLGLNTDTRLLGVGLLSVELSK